MFSKFSEAELYNHVSAVKQSDSRSIPTLLSNQTPDCNEKKYNPRHPYAFAGIKLPRLIGTMFPVYEVVVFPSARPRVSVIPLDCCTKTIYISMSKNSFLYLWDICCMRG